MLQVSGETRTEEDAADETNPNNESVPPIEVLTNTNNQSSAVRDEIKQPSYENVHYSVEPHFQRPVEGSNEKPVFRLPTPPPSSSSSSDEEEDEDSDTITVPESNSIHAITLGNPTANDQDINKTLVHETQAQSFPTNDEVAPLLDHVDSKIMNRQDFDGNNSISTFQTPRKKLSIGFDGTNDPPLSSLKPKSSSNQKQMNMDENASDAEESEEDVPLASFRNKNQKQPNSSKNYRDESMPDEGMHKQQLPSRVSLGKGPWKEKGGGNQSEDDTHSHL